MRTPRQIGAALCLCLSLIVGCRLISEQPSLQKHTVLQPARPSPDSVRMEIIWARFPASDHALNSEAWKDINETQIEPTVQRQLANNGLRAGVINGKMPSAISRALNQGESTNDDSSAEIDGETDRLLADPIVRGRIRQMPRNERYEVMASDVYASMPVLVSGQRELGGRTFEQAQAIYAMRVDPQPDQTTLVELTPELHHGAPRIRWTGGDEGVWHQAPLKEHEVFEQLRMKAKLAPGDVLVVMSLPDAGCRLGHYFHTTDSSDGPQQKMILIRLAEVPPSDAFAAMNE